MWGAKPMVSLRLLPRRIVGSLLTLAALYRSRVRKCGRLLALRKMVSARYRLIVRCAGDEKTG